MIAEVIQTKIEEILGSKFELENDEFLRCAVELEVADMLIIQEEKGNIKKPYKVYCDPEHNSPNAIEAGVIFVTVEFVGSNDEKHNFTIGQSLKFRKDDKH